MTGWDGPPNVPHREVFINEPYRRSEIVKASIIVIVGVLLSCGACSDDSGGQDSATSALDSVSRDLGDGGVSDGSPRVDAIAGADRGTPGPDSSLKFDVTALKCTDGFIPAPDGAMTTDGGTSRDGGRVICGQAKSVVIDEVAIGLPDYLAIENASGAPIDIKGYKLEMAGIGSKAVTFTVSKSRSVPAGGIVYIFEYTYGKKTGDINTNGNIPFYDGPPTANKENAVALYDAKGQLLDYMAIGRFSKNIPNDATFTPLAYPVGFTSSKHSWQRRARTGSCPNFDSGDWGIACLTRP